MSTDTDTASVEALASRLRIAGWLDDQDNAAAMLRSLAAERDALASERDTLTSDNANLRTVMVAAAEEIHAHWQAHCDAEGYGPTNLMHRLEQGIPSQYGYTAGRFAELVAERDTLARRVAELEAAQAAAQDTPPPDDPPIPDPREETKRALIAWATAYARKVAAAQAPRDVPRLTDDDIDTCIPVADGSAEVNVWRVEVLPGVMGQEYEEAAAWSLPLVRQISRAVEARVRELCGVAP